MANTPRSSARPKAKAKAMGRTTGRRGAPASTPADPSRAAAAKRLVREWSTWTLRTAKVVAHYGFIPLIIVIGMNSDPKPSMAQLLTPL